MEKTMIAILLFLIPFIAWCQDEQQLISEGNELYKTQQFDEAAKHYQGASALNMKNPKAHLNLGNALYKTKKTRKRRKNLVKLLTMQPMRK